MAQEYRNFRWGRGKFDVIPSLLAGEVTDMQGGWVRGPSPIDQGSPRKLPKAVSVNERREESVCDRCDRWQEGVRKTSQKRRGRKLKCWEVLHIDPVLGISHTFHLLLRSHSMGRDYAIFMVWRGPEKYTASDGLGFESRSKFSIKFFGSQVDILHLEHTTA